MESIENEAPSRGRAWASKAGALAVEALVVFLGVWSAFLLDGYRERQAAEAQRQQIHGALLHDLADAREGLATASKWFDQTFVESFLEPLEAGEKPLPRPIPISLASAEGGWTAILASGGLEVLDLEVIREVEAFLSTNRWLTHLAEDYNDYVRTVLVPELGVPVDESTFYVDGTPRLRGKYLWYYHSLTAMRKGLDDLTVKIESVAELLETKADKAE